MLFQPTYTVNQFCEAFGVGRTRLYELINAGALVAHKNGTRTIIRGDEAARWLESLPPLEASRKAA